MSDEVSVLEMVTVIEPDGDSSVITKIGSVVSDVLISRNISIFQIMKIIRTNTISNTNLNIWYIHFRPANLNMYYCKETNIINVL